MRSSPILLVACLLPACLLPPAACLGQGRAALPDTAAAPPAAAAAPADTTGHTLIPIPFVFYTPETETGFGAVVQYFFRGAAGAGRPSTVGPIVLYTTRRQFSVTLLGDLYLDRARWHLDAALGFSRFPTTFWGVGNDAPDAAEEDYTPRVLLLESRLERRLGPGWWAGPSLLAARRKLVEIEPGGLLDRRAVPGAADASVVGVGLVLTRDTRDATVYPRAGDLMRLEARLFDGALGSDHEFTAWTADLRRYLPAGPGRVLALQVRAATTAGRPPFDLLPYLGGQELLRGYYEGRYRDRNLLAAQAELRTGLWRRLGMAFFAGAGQVAHRPEDLTWGGFRAAGGLGLRVLLSRREGLNLRMDWGAGEGETGFYLAGGEAF